MKTKYYALGLLGLAVLLGLALFRGSPTADSKQPAPPPISSAQNPADSTSGKGAASVVSSSPAKTAAPLGPNPVAIFHDAWAIANGRDLTFYGKVIDQFGPVANAEVDAYVMKTMGFEGTSETPHVTHTDANGNFEFHWLHGQRMGIVPKKDGYVFEQRGNGNWTEDYKPATDNRVVFKMWRLMGSDAMTHSRLHDYIPCDGTILHYDLRTGQRVLTGGDLTVQITRNPVNIVHGTHFDWSLTLSVPGGGLIPESDLYPNEAPASGYQPSVTISMPANSQDWSVEANQSYYFYNGTAYGRMNTHVRADFQPPPTVFNADIYENPGSRNLEFSPSKRLMP